MLVVAVGDAFVFVAAVARVDSCSTCYWCDYIKFKRTFFHISICSRSLRVVECSCVKHFTDHFVSVAAAAAVAPSLHFIISYKFFSYFPRCEYTMKSTFLQTQFNLLLLPFFSGSIHFRQSFYEAICFSRAQSTLLHTHIFAIVYTENCLNRQNKWQ